MQLDGTVTRRFKRDLLGARDEIDCDRDEPTD
jgi:hypothetical protein